MSSQIWDNPSSSFRRGSREAMSTEELDRLQEAEEQARSQGVSGRAYTQRIDQARERNEETRRRTGSGSAGSAGGRREDLPPNRDFHAETRALFPWMPDELVRVYSDEWERSGNPQLALAEMRRDSRYQQHFPGNVRPDGSVRFSEQEWISVREGYRREISQYGISPNILEHRITDLFEGEVSPQEFAGRLQAVAEGVAERGQDVQRWYADNYGIDMSEPAIMASAIDPQIGRDVLERRVTSAQIGGSAAAFGFTRSRDRARELRRAGLSGQDSRQLYEQAARNVPTLASLGQRFGGEPIGLREFEEAAVMGDVGTQRRIERVQRQEQSLFSGSSPVARDEAGRRRGLAQR